MDNKSIFRQESIDRALSPEQFDEYIRVTNPGIWFILTAFLVLSASVLVWGFTGTLPKTITVNGIIKENGIAACFVSSNKLENDIVGCKAQIITVSKERYSGIVTDVSSIPLSEEEISGHYESDWIINKLVADDYSYAVDVSFSDAADVSHVIGSIVSVTLIVEEIKPISYLLN